MLRKLRLMKKVKLSIVDKLYSNNLIKPPPFLIGGVHYETMMGSVAYGCNDLNTSDIDVYGFCIPPKNLVFPHLSGYIEGFGRHPGRFEQFQQHHILDKGSRKEYDLSVYNIVKYFDLCMSNNPNMIDSMFTPEFCVLHATKIGRMVRNNRQLFLHKGCWHKFKGYAYSQMKKLRVKDPEPEGKRYELIMKYGYDIKFAYHVVRLLNEVEQILSEYDLDLLRNREQLKSIRRGEWSIDEIEKYFYDKERDLETIYTNSKIPQYPDETRIKKLLLECLEEHYGSLHDAIQQDDKLVEALKFIDNKINDIRGYLYR